MGPKRGGRGGIRWAVSDSTLCTGVSSPFWYATTCTRWYSTIVKMRESGGSLARVSPILHFHFFMEGWAISSDCKFSCWMFLSFYTGICCFLYVLPLGSHVWGESSRLSERLGRGPLRGATWRTVRSFFGCGKDGGAEPAAEVALPLSACHHPLKLRSFPPPS
jgi:hypothetical protein